MSYFYKISWKSNSLKLCFDSVYWNNCLLLSLEIMSGLHPAPMQARLDNMKFSLFTLISVERIWSFEVQSGSQLMEEFKTLGQQQICIYCTSSRNPSCLLKMTSSSFLVRLFPKHWEIVLCIYELARLTRVLLVQGLGSLISGRKSL